MGISVNVHVARAQSSNMEDRKVTSRNRKRSFEGLNITKSQPAHFKIEDGKLGMITMEFFPFLVFLTLILYV